MRFDVDVLFEWFGVDMVVGKLMCVSFEMRKIYCVGWQCEDGSVRSECSLNKYLAICTFLIIIKIFR